MSKRSIAVKPAQTLEIILPGGRSKDVVFNMEALMLFTEEFGDISRISEEHLNRPYETASMILYAGMAVLDSSTTIEDAKEIMVGGGVALLAEIMHMFQESFSEIDQEELKKNLIPVINKHLKLNRAQRRAVARV